MTVCHPGGMAHRPYPVRDRALRQIMRRHRNELPHGREAAERVKAALAALPSSGTYLLSTRPGVVSGGS